MSVQRRFHTKQICCSWRFYSYPLKNQNKMYWCGMSMEVDFAQSSSSLILQIWINIFTETSKALSWCKISSCYQIIVTVYYIMPCLCRYFHDVVSIFCEFVPMVLYLGCLFGYLSVLIVYKFAVFNASTCHCAPTLLISKNVRFQ
jgi:V-type ATPase 116kDa subunit family